MLAGDARRGELLEDEAEVLVFTRPAIQIDQWDVEDPERVHNDTATNLWSPFA